MSTHTHDFPDDVKDGFYDGLPIALFAQEPDEPADGSLPMVIPLTLDRLPAGFLNRRPRDDRRSVEEQRTRPQRRPGALACG